MVHAIICNLLKYCYRPVDKNIMISSINNSISGIQAALDLQSVSAGNIANVATDEFKSDVAVVEAEDNGGVTVTMTKNTEPGVVYDRGDGVEIESSNVDLASEITNQISSKSFLQANVAAVKTADEMLGSLLDILA